MAYLDEVTPHVQKAITKLGGQDKAAQQRIQTFLEQRIHGCDDPRYLGTALRSDQQLRRYRVGDYRIICSIEDHRVTVLPVDVAHRREVYR